MRNKKGILILLTLALLCGCFTGCKKDKEDSKETTEAAQTTAVSSATLEAATSTETTTTYAQLYPEEDYDGTPDYTIPANDESSVSVSYVRDSFHPNAINGVVGYYAPVMEIPVDCTMISDSAFENNPTIETVSFQNPYTQLGTYSFSNCSSLSDLTLPTKLEVVTESAFQDCTQLQSLEIPESLTEIQKNAFYGCTALSYLTFQEGLKTIGDTAFYGQIVEGSDIKEVGSRVVKAFDAKQKFFHFEFFRLGKDKEGLGKKGDLVGLEVNMRAPGAYIPDMMNYKIEMFTIRRNRSSFIIT